MIIEDRDEMETEEESFAAMFERSQKDSGHLTPGTKVEATVLTRIGFSWTPAARAKGSST